MKLQPPSKHPHGLADHDFDALFAADKRIISAFHGYLFCLHLSGALPETRRSVAAGPLVEGILAGGRRPAEVRGLQEELARRYP